MILSGKNLCAQKNSGQLVITIFPTFNEKPLVLSEQNYINGNGDTLSIDLFKFYFSGLHLTDSNNKVFSEKESYHLINAEDSLTFTFSISNIPDGNYNSLEYAIGVDSLKNVSGALSGDLDPIKGMFWTWNTGYIAAKLEGRSLKCKTHNNAFDLHVGGYLNPYNTYRRNKLLLNNLRIVSGKTSYLYLYADVAEWFKNPESIDLSVINHIAMPDRIAIKIAENYKDMIKLKNTVNPK